MSDSEMPLVLTVDEVASLLRIGRAAAYQLVRENKVPALKIGRTLRIPRAAVLRLLDQPSEGVA